MATEHPWSAIVRLDEVPETGKHIAFEASEAVRNAVAKSANVDGIDTLAASFDLTRRGRDGLHAVGHVTATVRQTCVVTLEPLANAVDEAIDVTFAPPSQTAAAGDDTDIEVLSEDTPEPLVNGAVDLGALATEFLILGIDPYPRKAGVAFEPPAKGEAGEHPFAALAVLKKPGQIND